MGLFFPALAFAEGQCSIVHMLGSTGEYVFKNMKGWDITNNTSEGITKPGGHFFASGVLLRLDGKPLNGNEFNYTTLQCEHDYEYGAALREVSKGIKCRLTKAYVYESAAGKSCYLDLDENEFEMSVSLLGIAGDGSWYGCTKTHLEVNLHDKLVTITYYPDGTANCTVTPYTLRLSQVPKEREY